MVSGWMYKSGGGGVKSVRGGIGVHISQDKSLHISLYMRLHIN